MSGEATVDAPAADPAVDPELPARLLDEILARPEFAARMTEERNPLGDAIGRLAAAWSQMPTWVDAALTGVVIAAAIALVLWLLVDIGGFGRRGRRARQVAPSTPGNDGGPARASSGELYRSGRAAHAEGRPADAIILLFRAMIARLTERGFLLNDPSRTNREHLRDLRRRKGEARALRSAIPAFENVRYGKGEPVAADVAEALAAAQALFPTEPR